MQNQRMLSMSDEHEMAITTLTQQKSVAAHEANLLKANENLNVSYIRKLKEAYNSLNIDQKISVQELNESIESMQVDEVSKQHIMQFVMEQTNSDMPKE